MRRSLLIAFVTVVFMSRCPSFAAAPASQPAESLVAVFNLRGPLVESPPDDLSQIFGEPQTSLRDLVDRLNKAAGDANVKAVVLLAENPQFGFAQVQDLRHAIKSIRDAGKQVYVHSDSMRMGEYVLFSGASRISVVPTADLWITGLGADQPYIRGLLDKIHVTPDFMTCGEYKSAAELFMRTQPSKQADEMMNWLLDGLYDTAVKLIADGRGVEAGKVKGWIDNGPYLAEPAKEAGIIDAVESRQDFDALLKNKYGEKVTLNRKYGVKEQPELDFSSPFAFFKIWAQILNGPPKKDTSKDAVAIVYVDGMILPGSGGDSIFGGSGMAFSTPIRKALDDARRDSAVKAVVLRIDSPGGSAVASEIILDASKRVKQSKPLVVSMGNVAGSGGYYVACGSDTIFAEDASITGSIGVVVGKLVTTEMWNQIGITFKPYKRGTNALILSSDAPFSPAERDKIKGWMNSVYDTFKQHVTDIRGDKLKKPIDEIAGGRVYTGRQALELGLVDQIGTLHDAIEFAARQAKITDYDVRLLPEPKNLFERLMEQRGGGDKEDSKWIAGGGTSVEQLALPYLQHLDPWRVQTIRSALRRLDLLQQEGVMLSMPEMSLWD